MSITLIAALALVLFSTFAGGVLIFSIWIVKYRFNRVHGAVLVDLSKFINDRLVLNTSIVVLLLLEAATLVWDNIEKTQFPQRVRWPFDIVVLIAVSICALRLFRHYLRSYTITPAKPRCPVSGQPCPPPPSPLGPHLPDLPLRELK